MGTSTRPPKRCAVRAAAWHLRVVPGAAACESGLSAARIEPRRAVMLELELGQQLAFARRGIVVDFPAEMRGVAPALEELVDQLAAQGGALAAGGADEHDLIVV